MAGGGCMKRTTGQILMLLLAMGASLVLGVRGVLPWDNQGFQWLFGVLALLVLIGLIDGLMVIGALLFPERGLGEGKQSPDDRKR